ncbi:MAG: trigger factor [Eubacterium sp.]|nr:trigger factor [Eubacterium sp.]
MSYTVEKVDGNKAVFTITVDSDKFNEARETAFKKNKNKISIPGFRKGKVPRKMIEKMYGKEVFDDDAINIAAPPAYQEVMDDTDIEIISSPDYEMVDVNDDDTFTFTATVAIKPDVKLGEYKGIEVEKRTVEVTDEDVDAELNRVREQNSRMVDVTDRAVKADDIVKIDFDGYVDEKQFDGGKGEDYSLTIGSHSFIDNFEDQLIGHEIGEDVDVNVTFPDEYHEPSLAGKPALFKVKIKGIQEKEMPEADDDFAEEVSEFDTLDEYKADIRKNITERREKEAADAKEAEAVAKLADDAEMEIADQAIDDQVSQMMQEFAYRLQFQGMDPNRYMEMTGMTPQGLKAQMQPEAERRLKTRFALEAVAEAENITAEQSDIDEEIAEMAKMYNADVEKYKEDMKDSEMETIKKDIVVKKAAKFVVDQAKEVEKKKEDKKEDKED